MGRICASGIDHYWSIQPVGIDWHDRIYQLLAQVGELPDEKLLTAWETLLDDMYGDEASRKQTVYELALKDENISNAAKSWLRQIQG